MRHPWANIALLILLIVQLLTGFGGLVSGAETFRWVLWLHGIGAYTILVVLLWKGAIVFDVLFRRRLRMNAMRLAFLGLTGLLLVITGTGLLWTYDGPQYVPGFSLMTIHALLSVALVGLLLWHTLARRWIVRVPRARDRRAFLRLLGTGIAGLALWRLADPLKTALALSGTTRRFTGSYQTGSFTGLFPETSWLFDDPQPVEVATWQLVIDGEVRQPLHLSWDEVLALAHDSLTATLDCTGGWYSAQEWTGVLVARLLDQAGPTPNAQSITVESVSGYSRRYTLEDAHDLLLATHVAGLPLAHGHGYPLRLVAPGQRGFAWVKWVVRLTVNDTSAAWQPPVPLQ